MTKQEIICSHCGCSTIWYLSCLHEISFKEVTINDITKIYCHGCIYEIAKYHLESSSL